MILLLACTELHPVDLGEVQDRDLDGYDENADCDDRDQEIHPGAEEVWYDGVDQDCDGHDDDQDRDGYDRAEDCDDRNDDAYPGAWETWYDGIDQDCSGDDDHDQDGDGWSVPDDCDDTDAGVRPGAPETCDGRDQDCDGSIDEGLTGPFTFYEDVDEDGYGSGRELVSSTCEAPDGYAYSGGDCNDGDEDRSPDAEEICDNGVDDDCDGIAPECGVVAGEVLVVDSEPVDGLVWLDGARIATADGVVHIDGRVLARTEVERLVDLGDVDDDGWRDLGLSGAGHVLLGPFDDEPVELLGQTSQTIRPAGDVDGDGFDDVLAGDSLFYGPVTGGLTRPDVRRPGARRAGHPG
ncbi:MAG: hypothetical protein GY913_34395 [Proteobacteria bacterium]|nr:hypothetical protein [Pseudomonadota bacterium]MCP4922020.1 hypothetical protein [Pseudomonadota bacterium]